jgi:hemoglobin
MEESEVYSRIGEDGFNRLVAAFYRQVPDDDILGPMYPRDDMEGAEQRLRDFLVFRFGGPTRYLAQRGHPRLRMRHAPFAIPEAARDRWVQIMNRALDETNLPGEVTQTLRSFFESTATFMINRQTPQPESDAHT